jgi:hypothetical protein
MALEYVAELRSLTERAAADLLRVSPELAARRPAPDKWSIKEIVGHLIDSASNNHQRFVRALWSPDLMCPTYDQDTWVRSQCYTDAPWPDLAVFWREYNLHLVRVMEAIPPTDRERPRSPHNLNTVAFRPVDATEPVTLGYLMRDYVEHLKHHLNQIADLREAAG